MQSQHDIKRGISLYSFQESFYFHRLDLEDCIAAAADMGAEGIEIIPDQMIREFPNVSDEFIDRWHGWMERYGTTPTCMDDFVETRLYKNRPIDEDEQLERFIRALKLARRLGCFIVREQFAIGSPLMTPSLLRRCLPYAEHFEVAIGMEVHSPNFLRNPEIAEFIEIMVKADSPFLTIIPDFSIFTRSLSPVIQDWAVRRGIRREIVDAIARSFTTKESPAEVVRGLAPLGLSAYDQQFIGFMGMLNVNEGLDALVEMAPYIRHFHGKTHFVDESGNDPATDVPAVVEAMKRMKYKGFISTEYEGNRFVHDQLGVIDDDVEQVRRHQALLERCLGH